MIRLVALFVLILTVVSSAISYALQLNAEPREAAMRLCEVGVEAGYDEPRGYVTEVQLLRESHDSGFGYYSVGLTFPAGVAACSVEVNPGGRAALTGFSVDGQSIRGMAFARLEALTELRVRARP